jgi:HlyD family secretion protein
LIQVHRHLRNPRLLAAVVLVFALLAVALWPETVPADTAVVARGLLQVTVDEEGETRVRERFVVSAPVAGRVLRIELEAGDRVARGAALARFLPVDPALLDARSRAEAQAAAGAAESALGRARAELQRAEAALALARSEAERHRELARAKIVAAGVLEAKEAELRAAEESLRAARFAVAGAGHERAMARARLDPPSGAGGAITITSPVDGVVLRRLRESESVVAAGEPLLEVGDPRALEIVSDLLSTDAVRVRPGHPVLVEQWGGDRTLHGTVRRVEPSGFMKVSALGVEEQRVNVVVDLADPEEAWKALGDGYRVEVRIVIWEAKDAVKVPTTSLFRAGEAWSVFVVEGGRARARAVEIGKRGGLEAEVRKGLAPGETVIVHPSDRIAEGVRVAPAARE